jgi:hypothetical protein
MKIIARWLCAALLLCLALPVLAGDDDSVGQVKVSRGMVKIERNGQVLAADVGTLIMQHDRITTGQDGAVGITFEDNSMLSAGPGSLLEISRFVFDTTTYEGEFETRLDRGTLSAISGKIAKQTPEAMRVKTPSAILGVRGTEFYVKVGDDVQAPPDVR